MSALTSSSSKEPLLRAAMAKPANSAAIIRNIVRCGCLLITFLPGGRTVYTGDGCRSGKTGRRRWAMPFSRYHTEVSSMKARIKWVEDRTFIGESGSGHKIVLGTAFG